MMNPMKQKEEDLDIRISSADKKEQRKTRNEYRKKNQDQQISNTNK